MVQPTPELMRKFGQKRSDYEPDPFEQALLATLPDFCRIEIRIKEIPVDLDYIADRFAELAERLRTIKRQPERSSWLDSSRLFSAVRMCDGQIKAELQRIKWTTSRGSD